MTDELPIVLLQGSAPGSYSWAAVRMGVVQGIDYLEPLESFRTTSLSINFFRLVWQARLRVEAHVVSQGRIWVISNVMSPIRMVSRSQKRAVAASFCEANTQNIADRGTPLFFQFPGIRDPT